MDELTDWFDKVKGKKIARSTLRMYLSDLETKGYEVTRPKKNGDHITLQKNTEEADRSISERPDLFDLAWDEYRELIGMSRKHKSPKQSVTKNGNRRKLVICSDTHGSPYQAGVVSILNERPDVILVVGDIFDMLSLSRFPHLEEAPIETEMANIRAMAEQFSSVAEVLMCKGNHDARVFRFFAARVDTKYLKFVNTDMLSMSITGLSNCKVVENMHGWNLASGRVLPDVMKDDFMIFQGDACFMHAESARKGDQSTVRALANEWYPMWRGVLGLPDIKVLGQAHVHASSIAYGQGGHLLTLELGCLLNPQVLNYQLSGDTRYRAATIGYWILEQSKNKKGEWTTEPNSVRFELC